MFLLLFIVVGLFNNMIMLRIMLFLIVVDLILWWIEVGGCFLDFFIFEEY